MPAYIEQPARLGAKLVTVFNENHARGLPSHLATIVLLDPDTGALIALMDGRYITETRTAAVSAVSARHLSRPDAGTLAIIGSGVQARSHLEAYAEVRALDEVRVWSPKPRSRERFVDGDERPRVRRRFDDRDSAERRGSRRRPRRPRDLVADAGDRSELGLAGRARRVGRRVPARSARDGAGARRARAGCSSIRKRRRPGRIGRRRASASTRGGSTPSHIAASWAKSCSAASTGRTSDDQITIFKSLGMAVEDVVTADLVFRTRDSKPAPAPS